LSDRDGSAAQLPTHTAMMDAIPTHVVFCADRFPSYCDRSEGINHADRFGRRLAEFLRDGLISLGFDVGKPNAEDWGWVVPIANAGFDLWIGCGNYDEHPDGFLCFIEPHRPTVGRWWWKVDARPRVAALQVALDQLLSSEAGIRDKRWSTYEQFMGPTRPPG
jgi:hypothetical protein